MNKFIKQTLTLTIMAAVAIGISVTYAATWVGPTATAPNGNIEAPINASNNTQAKLGSLILNSNTPVQNAIGLTVFGTTLLNGNIQIATGSPSAGKVLTAVDSTGIATWATAGSGSTNGLAFGIRNDRTGDSVADTVAFNTVYQAQTDGIVYASIYYGSNWPKMKGYTDSSSNPTTLVSDEGPDDDGGNSSISFPVRKGDYWKVVLNGSYNNEMINWMPIVPTNISNNCQIRKGTITGMVSDTEKSVTFSSPFSTGVTPIVVATPNTTNYSGSTVPVFRVYTITNTGFKAMSQQNTDLNYIAISTNCAEL